MKERKKERKKERRKERMKVNSFKIVCGQNRLKKEMIEKCRKREKRKKEKYYKYNIINNKKNIFISFINNERPTRRQKKILQYNKSELHV